MINEENIKKLKNMIASKRFVNCYSREFSMEDPQDLDEFYKKLKDAHQSVVYVDIDIQEFMKLSDNNEEEEAKTLIKLINGELTEKGLNTIDIQSISISNALIKCSQQLESRVILSFRLFQNPNDEQEKNILRSLRKALRNKDEIKSYLNILIISDRKTYSWELYPESNLDERQVFYFKY